MAHAPEGLRMLKEILEDLLLFALLSLLIILMMFL